MALDPSALSGGGNTNPLFDPALGQLLISNPEMAVKILASMGHAPPGDVSGLVHPAEAENSLGKNLLAFNSGMDSPLAPKTSMDDSGPTRTIIPPPPQGSTPGKVGMEFGGPPQQEVQPESGSPATPSQQGAPEVPLPTPRPATPAPEQAQSTVDAARPEGDTSQQPGVGEPMGMTGGGGKGSSKREPMDDLSKALAGLKAMTPPAPQRISSPSAPHPTNQISRASILQALMQQMSGLGHPSTQRTLGESLRGR